ncbi:MAG: hypothetical protein ACJAS4_003519 [Bacteriovoracaceae bacterium]|jgi:hypothetical protein
MKWLFLALLGTAGAHASHECQDFAKDKATGLVELKLCDSRIKNCHVKKSEIVINSFDELNNGPSMDVYDFRVPVTGTINGEEQTVTIPVYAIVGLAAIGSNECVLHGLGIINNK